MQYFRFQTADCTSYSDCKVVKWLHYIWLNSIAKRLKASLNGLRVDFEIISMFIINTRASNNDDDDDDGGDGTSKIEPYRIYIVL